MAPFAPLLRPATFPPIHAPNNLPIMPLLPRNHPWGFDAPHVANVPMPAWDSAPTLGWDKPPIGGRGDLFSQFFGIGTLLD
jgi:hypothetical protein